jgi:hypothetical protein
MPTPTTADVLKQYRDELKNMEAAGVPNQGRYNDYQQRINELEYEQYQEYKSQDAKDKQGKKAGGKVMRSDMEKQTKYRKGGMCKSKKGYAAGGSVRGCGKAKRGVKKAKMY